MKLSRYLRCRRVLGDTASRVQLGGRLSMHHGVLCSGSTHAPYRPSSQLQQPVISTIVMPWMTFNCCVFKINMFRHESHPSGGALRKAAVALSVCPIHVAQNGAFQSYCFYRKLVRNSGWKSNQTVSVAQWPPEAAKMSLRPKTYRDSATDTTKRE